MFHRLRNKKRWVSHQKLNLYCIKMYLQPCHIATKTFCRSNTVTIMTVSAKLPHLYQVASLKYTYHHFNRRIWLFTISTVESQWCTVFAPLFLSKVQPHDHKHYFSKITWQLKSAIKPYQDFRFVPAYNKSNWMVSTAVTMCPTNEIFNK